MKRTLIKDLLSVLKKSKARYFSLILITLIGTLTFVGVNSVTPAMLNNLNEYILEQNISDITIFNQSSFTESELQAIKETNGIDKVEKNNRFDTLVLDNQSEIVSTIQNISDMDQPYIIDGVMPTSYNECLVDKEHSFLLGTDIEFRINNNYYSCSVVGVNISIQSLNWQFKGLNQFGTGVTQLNVLVLETFFIENSFDTYNYLRITTDYPRDNGFLFSNSYQNYMDEIIQDIEKIGNGYSLISTSYSNIGISNYYDDAMMVAQVGSLFPVVFFLVAGLIASTTITRLIDEQRTTIGTLVALGYTRVNITVYYLLYSLSSVTIGATIGAFAGGLILPRFVISAYSGLYQLPEFTSYLSLYYIILGIALSISIVLVTTIIVVLNNTNGTPAQLMRPKAPPVGKKILLENIYFIWSKFKFLDKVTLRNLFRYKKKLLLSIFGVAGCSALLLTGLGLQSAITPIVSKQFTEIYQYDYIAYSVPLDEEIKAHTFNELDNIDGVSDYLVLNRQNVTSINEENSITTTLNYVNDLDGLNTFVNLDTDMSKENNVVISDKIARTLKLEVQDEFYIILSDESKVKYTVSSISTNYIGNNIYILDNDKINIPNVVLVKSDTREDLSSVINDLSAFYMVDSVTTLMERSSSSMSGLDNIVYLLVSLAIGLASIVMYSLTSINVSEREKEIATLKVLGFFPSEVNKYIFKENIISTLFGLFFGVIVGTFLLKYIIIMAEQEIISFVKEIDYFDVVFSVVITLIVTVLVNFIMMIRIDKINMSDSLKSSE